MKKNKIKEFAKKHSESIKATVALTASFGIGYVVGFRRCDISIANGLEKVYLANPGFKETMNEAIEITQKAIKK